MKYFDASTWIGRWPFTFQEEYSAGTLAAHLRRRGIERALVSPLEAVLQPEPGRANRHLLESTRGIAALVPVPVVNPALANWRDELELCLSDSRVRAIRVFPNYHGYRLFGGAIAGFSKELLKRDVRLIVQVRLVDERHEYHAMKIKGVRISELDTFLFRNPGLRVMASGLLRNELFSLAKKHQQVLADLSFVEWHETMKDVLEFVSPKCLAMASHTPFLVTAAACAKLKSSALPTRVLQAVSGANLARWLE